MVIEVYKYMYMKPQLFQNFRYPNLISQILRVGQFCIDVYSIGTFERRKIFGF